MATDKGTFYITPDVTTRANSTLNRSWSQIAAVTAVMFALLSIIMSTIIATPLGRTSENEHTAQAGTFGMFCSLNMGDNMDSQAKWYQWLKSYPSSDKDGRRLTAQEALENGLFFTNYHGEGKGDFLVRDKEDESYKDNAKTDVSKLQSSRTLNNCTLNSLGILNANLLLGTANGISGIVQYIVIHTFDADMICSDVKDTSGDCFNMLKIIGGNGSSGRESSNSSKGGIIGALTGSLFFPLAPLVIIAVGAGAVIKLARAKIRDVVFGILWAVLAFLVSIIMLLNPSLLAKAPLTVSNTLASCIIGAFSNGTCGSNTSTDLQDSESTSNAMCRSSAKESDASDDMQMIAGSLTCKIWKAFILNMYAEGSFGTGFDNLDTLDTSRPTNKILTDAGLNPEDYCVNLYSEKSIDSQKNGTLKTTDNGKGNKVCNLVTYQMYLEVQAQSGEDKLPEAGKPDVRWYKIIDAAAANSGFWSSWSGSIGSVFHKVGIAMLAIFVVVLGGFILIVTSLYAAVYFISSLILMIFSPVFLLIGIDPDRGRRILLGFFQKVASNVMKYIASAAFLVAAIAIYGGILDDIDSIPQTILFVLLITMALFMYRKELVELLGRVNAGGEELSSRMSDRLGRTMRGAGQGTTRMVGAGVGGAVGAKMAGGTMRSGFADAAKRNLKRGGGFVGNVARQVDRENVANRGKLKNKEQEAKQQERDAQQKATNWQNAGKGIDKDINQAQKDRVQTQKEIDKLENERFKKTRPLVIARQDMLSDADLHLERVKNNPDATREEVESAKARSEQMHAYVRFEGLGAAIERLEKQKATEIDPGERDRIQKRINEYDVARDNHREVYSNIDGRTFEDIEQEIGTRADKIANGAKFSSTDESRLTAAKDRIGDIDSQIDSLRDQKSQYDQKASAAHREAAEAGQRGRMYGEINDRNAAAAGRTVTAKTVDKADKKVSKARQEKGFVSKETAKKDLKAEHKRNRGKTKVTPDVHVYGDEDTDLDGNGSRYTASGEAIAPPRRRTTQKRGTRRSAPERSARRARVPSPMSAPSAATPPDLPPLDDEDMVGRDKKGFGEPVSTPAKPSEIKEQSPKRSRSGGFFSRVKPASKKPEPVVKKPSNLSRKPDTEDSKDDKK